MKRLNTTINMRADSPEARTDVAREITEMMYGAHRSDFPDVPYSPEGGELFFWVLDSHNDWFLKFSDDNPQNITIWHRNPYARHELILGALASAIEQEQL